MEGFNLKEVRTKARVTQQELADSAGVTRQAIANYENGWSRPSVDTAKAIAKKLDFDWTLFFA